MEVIIDSATLISIVEDAFTICSGEEFSLTATNYSDSIVWYSNAFLDCNNCQTINLQSDTTTTFYAFGYTDGCESVDTITVSTLTPIDVLRFETICEGDSIDFYGQILKLDGIYEQTIGNCDSTIVLELEVESIYTSLHERRNLRG